MTCAGTSPIRHLYLVDGSGYIFRAYFALPKITAPDGTPTGAAYGFTNMLIKLLRESDADGLAVVFDAGRKSFRNDLYAEYKAQRPEAPEDLVPQFPMIREATRAFNLPCLELEGYEADDIIATLAERARAGGTRVTIVSSDKDLMQLVGPGIAMLDPIKNRPIGPDEVVEKFGVPPEKVPDVQALCGDPVDNVPGVPGIGIKTAAELIRTYGDLETLLEHAGEIKQAKRRERLVAHAEDARLSRRLVELDRKVPLEEGPADFGLREPDPEELRAFLEKYGFRSILARLADKLAAGDVVPDEREGGERIAEAAGGLSASPVPAAAGPGPRYELLQEPWQLAAWVAAARESGVVAIDTETTSLDTQSCELVGVSLALGPGRACYVPLAHRAPPAPGTGSGSEGELDFSAARSAPPRQIPREEALALLKPLLEDPGVLKVGQNVKFDFRVLARCGIALSPFDDTMLLSYVLEGGLHGHGMDELAELHLDRRTISYKEVCGSGRNAVTFDHVPLDRALAYAAEDADVTFCLWQAFKPQLVPARMASVYETLERPLVPVLAGMEALGVKVDRTALARLSNDFARRIEALEQEIFTLAGRRFTIGSPKQLGEILFDELGLAEGGRKGKSGAYATGADVLEALALQGHELPRRILDWRQLTKLKSTYTDALQQQVDADSGRVHTTFGQAIASTGRLSSNDPNLQNIPVRTEEGRKIREAFVAESGFRLLSVDYSQIELRLTAHIADVPALKQAFADGNDIHAMTASQVFGVPVEGMDPQVRRRAKAINFGIIYGISPFGLAQNLGIEQAEAKAYIEAYFARFPGIRDYMARMKDFARRHGYVATLFGRKVHIPALTDKNPARRAFGERAAINAPIQGTAADIIKRAMIRVPPALREAGLGARMLLQVHDELLFEVPEAEVAATAALVKQVMEQAALPALTLSVPLVADVGLGSNWAEAH